MTQEKCPASADSGAAERLIVALDVRSSGEAMNLVDRLGESVSFYKVGWELFMGTHFQVPEELLRRRKKVFLDLKIGDIPATVRRAVENVPANVLAALELMTLQGASSVAGALRESRPSGKPRLLMVTILSSVDDEDLRELHGESADADAVVARRAERALDAGCDGIIASGDSVAKLRARFGLGPLIVVPGIRPRGAPRDDQKRLLTPFEAARDGADYLVVGRPIRNAADPKAMAEEMIQEIKAGLRERSRLTESVH